MSSDIPGHQPEQFAEKTPIEQLFEDTFAGTPVQDIYATSYHYDKLDKTRYDDFEAALAEAEGDEIVAQQIYQTLRRYEAAYINIYEERPSNESPSDLLHKSGVLYTYTHWQIARIKNPPNAR